MFFYVEPPKEIQLCGSRILNIWVSGRKRDKCGIHTDFNAQQTTKGQLPHNKPTDDPLDLASQIRPNGTIWKIERYVMRMLIVGTVAWHSEKIGVKCHHVVRPKVRSTLTHSCHHHQTRHTSPQAPKAAVVEVW